VTLTGEVECDEVYVVAGHKGQPTAVRAKGRDPRRNRLKACRGRGTLEKEKPPIFGMIQRNGEVVIEKTKEVVTVNGHSHTYKRSENTNFAILVSSAFTEPFDDPIGYGLYIARLANLLGNGPIVQRLGDLLAGRRSTPERMNRCLTRPTLPEATPGDLSFVFPYRHLQSIIEMLQALEKIAPGVYSRHTLLYGVEVKFYSNRIELSAELETGVKNLFAIGDGAGITRGLIQASASGILAARTIAQRLNDDGG